MIWSLFNRFAIFNAVTVTPYCIPIFPSVSPRLTLCVRDPCASADGLPSARAEIPSPIIEINSRRVVTVSK